jgi:hypothetical protein
MILRIEMKVQAMINKDFKMMLNRMPRYFSSNKCDCKRN